VASDAAVAAFLDDLFDAAIFPERWPDAVEGFRRLMNGVVGNVSSHLNVINLDTGLPSHNWISGVDPELVKRGTEYYFQQDKWVDASFQRVRQGLRQGEDKFVIFSSELLQPGELQSTEFYQDFLRPFDVIDMMCATSVVGQSKMFSLVANPIDSRPFDSQDKELLQTLQPHIDRAFRLSAKLGFAEAGKAVSYLWENSELPVMVMQQGRLTYANPAAERVLRMARIVARSGAGLLFAEDEANAALRKLGRHESAGEGEAPGLRQTAMQLHDSAGERWTLQLVRLNPPRQDLATRLFSLDPGVFIMLTPMNAASTLRAGSIGSIARFTAVEKQLLRDLIDGRTIQQIARQSGRSEDTLRWHVRNLLSKSGLGTMTELIRFASLLMPF